MRSASAGAVIAALLLTGCATTQQEAARLQLNSARIRASQLRTRVRRADPAIKVGRITVLDGVHGTAIVVALRNLTGSTLTDLPISVGVLGPGGRRRYLNGAAGAGYFQSHVSAIGPGASLDWVLTRRARINPTARTFAIVGASAGFSHARALPRIEAYPLLRRPSAAGVLNLNVRNLTAIPQYELQVYATVTRANRLLAAGVMTVPHLGGDDSARVRMRLVGARTGTTTALQAPATIFG